MTEDQFMPAICFSWRERARSLCLKTNTKTYRNELGAFLQGALAALVATGAIPQSRAHQLGFLYSVDRLDEWIAERAKEYDERAQALVGEGGDAQ